MSYFIGIDPGLVSGAWGVIDHHGALVGCGDIPHASGKVQPCQFAQTLRECIPPSEAAEFVIEQVHSMPGQGVASTFAFGQACGVIYAVTSLLLHPVTYVTPQCWKKRHGLIGKDKSASLTLARSRWPTAPLGLKKHHGRAEALLLALYGMETMQ